MDLEISDKNNDLIITDGDVVTIIDLIEFGQQVKQRLQTFQKEWFLDLNFGPNLIKDVLIKNPSITLVRSVLTAEIELALDDTVVLSELEVVFVNETRILEVAFTLRNLSSGETLLTRVVLG